MELNTLANGLYANGVFWVLLTGTLFGIAALTFFSTLIAWVVVAIKELNGVEYRYHAKDSLTNITAGSLITAAILGVIFMMTADTQSENIFYPYEIAKAQIAESEKQRKIEEYQKTLDNKS